MAIAFNNTTRTLTLTGGTSAARLTPANIINDATAFSTGSTYAVGAIVRHDAGGGLGTALYRCTTAVTVAGAFAAANWTVTATVQGVRQIYVSAFLTISGFYDDSGWHYTHDWGLPNAGAGCNWLSGVPVNSLIGLGFSVTYNGNGINAGGYNILLGATSADSIAWGKVRFFPTGNTNRSVNTVNSSITGSIGLLVVDNALMTGANNTHNAPSLIVGRLEYYKSLTNINPQGVGEVGHTGDWTIGTPFNRIGVANPTANNPLRKFATDLPADLSRNIGIIGQGANQYFEDIAVPSGFDFATMIVAFYAGMSAFFTRSVNLTAKQGSSLLSGVTIYGTNDLNGTVAFTGSTNALGQYTTKALIFSGNRVGGGSYTALENQTYTRNKTVLFRRQDLTESTYQQDMNTSGVELTQFMSTDVYWTADGSTVTGVSANAATKTITITGVVTLDRLYDFLKYWLALPGQMAVANMLSPSGTQLSLLNDWGVTCADGGVLNSGTKLKTLSSPAGLIGVSGTGAINVPYRDSLGIRVSVIGLNPQGFATTWYLRYRLQGTTSWTNTTGTGNSTVLLLNDGTYDVQVRSPGYDWKVSSINTLNSLSLELSLLFQASADGTPQYQQSFDSVLEALFSYDHATMSVKVTNTSGSIVSPGFPELYRAIQRIMHLPELVWLWTNPIRANATSQKIIIPDGNPISFFLSADSTASVKTTCPVVHDATGLSADDRVKGNTAGYSIILGSSATAESAGIAATIINAIGGASFDSTVHGLSALSGAIKDNTDSLANKTEQIVDDLALIKGAGFNPANHGLDKASDFAQIASKNGQV